jgi:hypothetical protein
MPEPQTRSPRAEKARNWFWATFAIAMMINAYFVQIGGLEFLDHGWWLIPRSVLLVITVVSGVIWAWETYKRRQNNQNAD